MTGMDRWIDWNKSDFIVAAGSLQEKNGNGPEKRLVTLAIDADDADASGYELSGLMVKWLDLPIARLWTYGLISHWLWRW